MKPFTFNLLSVYLKPLITLISMFLLFATVVYAESGGPYLIQSPDKTIGVLISSDEQLSYSVLVDNIQILERSPIDMILHEGDTYGLEPVVTRIKHRTINRTIKPVIPEKFALINDHCNELELYFRGNYSLVFRAYNNGIAYQFKTTKKGQFLVVSERATFNFSEPVHIYFPEEDSFFSHNERSYRYVRLDTLSADRLASLPVLVETSGPKVLISESSLRDYPGMWLLSSGTNSLYATFPHFPLESKLDQNSDRDMPVTKYADYIASTSGKRSFPWRILAIARDDADLIVNQLVFQLADESKIEDPSWIKPGKVAWDWWNANNIYGVDFKSGVNTATYKYYIDFAARFGIEYIILDEGWYKLGDLLDVVPEMDVEEIVRYGREKNVGIILWVIWKTLDDQLTIALDRFHQWGVAGIKVDFMQRDDQEMVNFYWKIAREAAARNMLVDFHGAYKPAGLRRAYPNVITREGVKGLENAKWSAEITPTHDLTIPFIRMVPGPMDYTPGAMVNAQPRNFRSIFEYPMSMGTRVHQIAMYVVFESPLQMMADSPSNYLKEIESTEFIAKIPTVWEDTKVLKAKVGEYLIVARKNGANWYIGAMTNEMPREMGLELTFLDDNPYIAEIFEDGINADRFASDYRRVSRTVSKHDTITLKLAPGGGWCAILMPGQP